MPVTHLINATLDGRCDHRNVIPDDDLHAHALETIAHVDAILFGSGTYRLLAPYWSQAARDASGTEVTNEFARVFAATPKILFSATAEPWPEWNTTVDRSDPVERVRELRADGEENLVVQASPQLARTLRRAGLIDRLRLLLRPLVAAPGPRCSIRTSTTTTSS
jgi:riboflavin biosynthesis pyrimidine reductase